MTVEVEFADSGVEERPHPSPTAYMFGITEEFEHGLLEVEREADDEEVRRLRDDGVDAPDGEGASLARLVEGIAVPAEGDAGIPRTPEAEEDDNIGGVKVDRAAGMHAVWCRADVPTRKHCPLSLTSTCHPSNLKAISL